MVEKTPSTLAHKISHAIGMREDYATPISGLKLYRFTAPTAPTLVTYEPSLTVVAQGRKRVVLGPKIFTYDASKYLLTSLDLPVLGQVMEATEKSPYLCLVLKIEMSVVREILSRDELSFSNASTNSPAMVTGKNSTELLDACVRLVDLLRSPKDIPYLSWLIQREIVYRLLLGSEGARLRAIATLGDQSQRVAKAISWIKANYAKPLRVEELARLSGMGVSTLHHHFRALTAVSPLQYQKQVRLYAARQRMLIDGIDAASAAFEVGYESASQFSREYSRFFGQSPLRDVRKLRNPS